MRIMNMHYVFFGSPEFAAIILERLIAAGMAPEIVVCNPDRPLGRKKIITPPPTKVVAERHGIPVCQPPSLKQWGTSQENIRKSDFRILKGFDFFVVAAYAQIIPQAILDLPRLGTIGVHPSLLPKYRGATPIQSVILNGEKETGVTLYLMDAKMDHGATIAKCKVQIATRITYLTLMRELAAMSAQSLIEMLPKLVDEKITSVPQDHSEATFTKKFETEDGFVDLVKDDPVIIDRKVRALNPDPGVYTFINMKSKKHEIKKTRMKILETKIIDEKLQLVTTQIEGKKPVTFQRH